MQMAVFILLISAAFSFCIVPEANGFLNCTEQCAHQLRADLKYCGMQSNYVAELTCKNAAYINYLACLYACNGSGYLSHWLSYSPQSIINYEPEDIKKIAFHRCDSTGILEGPGSITNVDIYIIACENIDTTVDLTSMAFEFLGNATYNGETGAWELDWNTDSYDSQGGYLIMADYLDPDIEGGEGFGMALAMVASQRVPVLSNWGLPTLIILILLSGLIMSYIKFKNRFQECS